MGQKTGLVIQGLCMCLSGFCLGFFKGWSLALVMLVLCPIIIIGVMIVIKASIAKYHTTAGAYTRCAGLTDQTLNAIRVVVAFGMEESELDNF